MGQPKKIAFLCYDTAFFVRHFRPAVEAARGCGFEIAALLPRAPEESVDFLRGVQIVRIRAGRSRHPLLSLVPDLMSLVASLRDCRPDIVQVFGAHGCLVLSLASWRVSLPARIYTVTGLGLLDIDTRWKHRIARWPIYRFLRAADTGDRTWFVFENATDPIRLGFRRGRPKHSLTLMGAGVNTSELSPEPLPPLPPLKTAVVARMIWSKGVDLAVEAVSGLIARGVPVELDIYGAPDFHNQRYLAPQILEQWGRRPGIRWHGHLSDIRRIWREHHLGLVPSRGGEGLPRAMLEAAACGRALVTTDVPGCADFVRSGIDGIVVKPNSVEALMDAIKTFVGQTELLERMGRSARQRVVENSTEQLISSRYRALYSK